MKKQDMLFAFQNPEQALPEDIAAAERAFMGFELNICRETVRAAFTNLVESFSRRSIERAYSS